MYEWYHLIIAVAATWVYLTIGFAYAMRATLEGFESRYCHPCERTDCIAFGLLMMIGWPLWFIICIFLE